MKKILPLLLLAVIGALLYYLFLLPKPGGLAVYFFKNSQLTAVSRPLAADEEPAEKAMTELLKGPSPIEQVGGYVSQFPKKVKLLGMSRRGEMVSVNFSRELEKYGGGTERVQGIVAQIVYTLTEIPGIKTVKLLVEGRDEVVLGGEGYVIDKPLTRADLEI